jgi:hypothetical protein
MQTTFESTWRPSAHTVLKSPQGVQQSLWNQNNSAFNVLRAGRSPLSILNRLGVRTVILYFSHGLFRARAPMFILGLLVLSIPLPCQAQLFLGPVNSDVQLESLDEFVLYDSVSKSQVLAFEFTFRSDEMPLGLIVPVATQDQQTLGKHAIFEALKKVSKPKHQKQRKLQLSFISYLWRFLSVKTPSDQKQGGTHRGIKPSASEKGLTHQQAVDWAIRQGLYVSFKTAKSLHILAGLGHRFNVLLLEPTRLKSNDVTTRKRSFRSPTLYIRTRTERPQPLNNAFGGEGVFSHTLSVLSDKAYRLQLKGESSFNTIFRNYLNKRVIKKLLSSMPKALHTYQRAAYFQTFELPSEYHKRVQVQVQRIPSIVKPKNIASYEPMLITIPVEALLGLLLFGAWAWNRERSPLRSARSNRIRGR